MAKVSRLAWKIIKDAAVLNDDPYLSIIIVCHRSENVIESCLKAIAESDFSQAIEVILVENPPEPGRNYPDQYADLNIKNVQSRINIGFAAGSNLGASVARGKFLLFLNPDVYIKPESLTALHQVLVDNPKHGMAAGRLVSSDGQFQASCRRFPTTFNLFFSRKSLLKWLSKKAALEYTHGDFEVTTPVDATAAAFVMIAAELFVRLGRFDERYFLYVEDTDLCLRLSQAGYQTLFVPAAIGLHGWEHATQNYRFRRIWWHHQSIWRYFVKHLWSVPRLAVIFPALVVNCLLSMGLELFRFKK